MKVAAISDVHLTPHCNDLQESFLRFLNHPLVGECQHLFLLGDIFDVMVGNHIQYLRDYARVFQQLAKLLSQGVEIYYCEGNHDFHLEKLFATFLDTLDDKAQVQERFHLVKNGTMVGIGDKIFFICHGDELELDNAGHQRYRRAINSRPMGWVANYLLPYWLVQQLGQLASSTSRELNRLQYQSPSLQLAIRQKFRHYAKQMKQQFPTIDYLLCGHGHIQDYYQHDGLTYLNNGFFPLSQTFIYLSAERLDFIPL